MVPLPLPLQHSGSGGASSHGRARAVFRRLGARKDSERTEHLLAALG
jgi:hypothetical protein